MLNFNELESMLASTSNEIASLEAKAKALKAEQEKQTNALKNADNIVLVLGRQIPLDSIPVVPNEMTEGQKKDLGDVLTLYNKGLITGVLVAFSKEANSYYIHCGYSKTRLSANPIGKGNGGIVADFIEQKFFNSLGYEYLKQPKGSKLPAVWKLAKANNVKSNVW